MDQIRDALLDADVNYNVVKEFTEEIRKDCLGIEVLKNRDSRTAACQNSI